MPWEGNCITRGGGVRVRSRPQTPPPREVQLRPQALSQVQLGNEDNEDKKHVVATVHSATVAVRIAETRLQINERPFVMPAPRGWDDRQAFPSQAENQCRFAHTKTSPIGKPEAN